MRAPWPIAPFLRWRHRGAFLVRWEDIAMLGTDAVHLREGYRPVDPDLDTGTVPGNPGFD